MSITPAVATRIAFRIILRRLFFLRRFLVYGLHIQAGIYHKTPGVVMKTDEQYIYIYIYTHRMARKHERRINSDVFCNNSGYICIDKNDYLILRLLIKSLNFILQY